MLITDFIRSLQVEIQRLSEGASGAGDRLARHCIKHREQALFFHASCLQDVVTRFGDQDTHALLGLYDRLYGAYRQHAKRLRKQADALPAGPERDGLLEEATVLEQRSSRVSDLVALQLVSSSSNTTPSVEPPMAMGDAIQSEPSTFLDATPEAPPNLTRLKPPFIRKVGILGLAFLLFSAGWIFYSSRITPTTTIPPVASVQPTIPSTSGTNTSPLPVANSNEMPNGACFTWNNIPSDRLSDVRQLLEDNPLVQNLRTVNTLSEVWLLMPADAQQVKELVSTFKSQSMTLGTPQPIPWLASKGWLVKSAPTDKERQDLQLLAQKANGIVVSKPALSGAASSLSFDSRSDLLIERLRSFASKNDVGAVVSCISGHPSKN
jgi:hypothetical protein